MTGTREKDRPDQDRCEKRQTARRNSVAHREPRTSSVSTPTPRPRGFVRSPHPRPVGSRGSRRMVPCHEVSGDADGTLGDPRDNIGCADHRREISGSKKEPNLKTGSEKPSAFQRSRAYRDRSNVQWFRSLVPRSCGKGSDPPRRGRDHLPSGWLSPDVVSAGWGQDVPRFTTGLRATGPGFAAFRGPGGQGNHTLRSEIRRFQRPRLDRSQYPDQEPLPRLSPPSGSTRDRSQLVQAGDRRSGN